MSKGLFISKFFLEVTATLKTLNYCEFYHTIEIGLQVMLYIV